MRLAILFQPLNKVGATKSERTQVALYDKLWYGVYVRLQDDRA